LARAAPSSSGRKCPSTELLDASSHHLSSDVVRISNNKTVCRQSTFLFFSPS